MARLSKQERERLDRHRREEDARIAGQRALWNNFRAVAAVRDGMLSRAVELVCAGRCEEADALLEFLPEDDVDSILDMLFEDK